MVIHSIANFAFVIKTLLPVNQQIRNIIEKSFVDD